MGSGFGKNRRILRKDELETLTQVFKFLYFQANCITGGTGVSGDDRTIESFCSR